MTTDLRISVSSGYSMDGRGFEADAAVYGAGGRIVQTFRRTRYAESEDETRERVRRRAEAYIAADDDGRRELARIEALPQPYDRWAAYTRLGL